MCLVSTSSDCRVRPLRGRSRAQKVDEKLTVPFLRARIRGGFDSRGDGVNTKALKTSACLGAGLGAAILLVKVLRCPAVKRKLGELFDAACTKVDHRVGWSTLPTVGGLVSLVGIRNTLRSTNLYDTGVPQVTEQNPLPAHERVESWRTADGTSNDLKCPFMGSAGTRFGRNAPLASTWQEPMPAE